MRYEIKPILLWYNFATGTHDPDPDLSSDAVARQYIPQDAAAQGTYRCHRGLGKSILEAMAETLTAVVNAAEKGGQS